MGRNEYWAYVSEIAQFWSNQKSIGKKEQNLEQ